ncbi:MAG: hypothetical protein Q7R79_05000, partial [bacterium]|nr:hypothetical protein [bacterium]
NVNYTLEIEKYKGAWDITWKAIEEELRRRRRLGSRLVLSRVEGLRFRRQRLIWRYLSRWG